MFERMQTTTMHDLGSERPSGTNMLIAIVPTDKSVGYWHSVPVGTKKPTLVRGEGWVKTPDIVRLFK